MRERRTRVFFFFSSSSSLQREREREREQKTSDLRLKGCFRVRAGGVLAVRTVTSRLSSTQVIVMGLCLNSARFYRPVKKFMEQPADATSETHHAKSAVVTPPEDTDTLMNDEAMSD